ncbi:MAG: zinc ribbon domain-containing protein, partial [Methylobacillus glycogenes]|nr:zinc ribbon domain-containing protein [Methylobacillus glycogenes]
MPIYDYQCSSCGHKAELMRKVSEAVSTTCPQCGQASFEKQVSAPNFQLNGTGWYASDFKGSSPAKKTEDAA